MNQMKYFALRHKLEFFRKLIEFKAVFVWVWVDTHSYWGTFTIVQLSEHLIEMWTYRSGRDMICFDFIPSMKEEDQMIWPKPLHYLLQNA